MPRERSDEETKMKTYQLCEDGHQYETVEAESAAEALKIAIENVDRANYEEDGETLWIDVRVWNVDDEDDCERASVACDPPVPPCVDGGEHEWRAPHAIVGGIEENPGVWGHGGGVVMHECCMRCRCGRVTDTWAQRSDTGEQGLTSVKYEPGKYAIEESDDNDDAD